MQIVTVQGGTVKDGAVVQYFEHYAHRQPAIIVGQNYFNMNNSGQISEVSILPVELLPHQLTELKELGLTTIHAGRINIDRKGNKSLISQQEPAGKRVICVIREVLDQPHGEYLGKVVEPNDYDDPEPSPVLPAYHGFPGAVITKGSTIKKIFYREIDSDRIQFLTKVPNSKDGIKCCNLPKLYDYIATMGANSKFWLKYLADEKNHQRIVSKLDPKIAFETAKAHWDGRALRLH